MPQDGRTIGAVRIRGPWIVSGYYGIEGNFLSEDGWFRTGDLGRIDADGYLHLTDRVKDVIKSGGEWISSIDVENEVLKCPGVLAAALIAVPHPRWMERPLLLVSARPGETCCRRRSAPIWPRASRAGGCPMTSWCCRNCRSRAPERSRRQSCAQLMPITNCPSAWRAPEENPDT
ncbi:hypothetical protein EP867_18770 [Falsigemmobacter intermedius]|uniref:Uncharacterized protein n=1 Tax=Falsigemmobacter intermedius TaxID=1553448 RepID=A0A451GGE7_9RHOB|nr:hypothetical protein EP867_18770 [Falsigemmobacter intermedius]